MSFRFLLFTISLLCSSYVSSNLINHRIIRQAGFNHCQTPDRQLGKCILLNECPYLRKLLKSYPHDPQVAFFLQQSCCGFERNLPKFCCSISHLHNPSTSWPSPVTQPPAPHFVTQSPPVTHPPTSPPVTLLTTIPVTQPPTSSPTTTQASTLSLVTQPTSLITSPTAADNKPTSRRPPNKKDYSVCGKSTRNSVNIIGGKNATLGDWPWMVAVGYRTPANPGPQFRCGGSLISDKWVLTAGHCVVNIGTSTVTVARLGDLDLNELNEDGASPIDIAIDKIIPHPEFVSSPLVNDIALLRLRNPVTFTAQIRPICIPKQNEHKSDEFYANKVPFITGWGYTRANKPSSRSEILVEAQVDIVDRESCVAKYKLSPLNSSFIDDRILCAGRRGVDSCQGDSGGPLIIPIRASYYLVGIVSYGVGCANPFFPGVYTKVAYYYDWIKSTTGIEF